MEKNVRQIISAVIVITIIFTMIAIPTVAAVLALSSSAGWSADDHTSLLHATLSFSGGNGNKVVYWAQATSNLGLVSALNGTTYAISASFIGNNVSFNKTQIPFCTSHNGGAYYN